MEQQQLSIKPDQINEGYSLGERYHLGELQGEYYVAYTRADVRRYSLEVFLAVLLSLYLLASLVVLIYGYFLLSTSHGFFPFYILIVVANPFIMIYRSSQRRKWGNRPVITPRNRHLRVYVYQDGLVKQTNQKSEAIRWSDLYLIQYEPLQPAGPQKPATSSKKMAGIKLILRNNRRVTINGALHNLDGLAQRLNGQDPTSWGRVVPKPHF